MSTWKKAGKLLPGISFGLSLLLLLSALFLSNVPAHETYTYENGAIVAHSWQSYFRLAQALVLCAVLAAAAVSAVILVFSKIKRREKIAKKLLGTGLADGAEITYLFSPGGARTEKVRFAP